MYTQLCFSRTNFCFRYSCSTHLWKERITAERKESFEGIQHLAKVRNSAEKKVSFLHVIEYSVLFVVTPSICPETEMSRTKDTNYT